MRELEPYQNTNNYASVSMLVKNCQIIVTVTPSSSIVSNIRVFWSDNDNKINFIKNDSNFANAVLIAEVIGILFNNIPEEDSLGRMALLASLGLERK